MNKNIQAIYPLSPLQEGILYHTIETPNSDIYFQQFSCVVEALSKPDKWQESWQQVANKHAIMRTLFTWENRPQPLQIVRERVTLPWTNLDWRDVPADQYTKKWEAYKLRDRDLNFDMSTAPLVRFTLVNLGNERYYFLFSFHHIVLDGWSQRLLFDEAITAYNAPLHQDNLSKTPKRADYAEFIEWVERQDKQAAKVFWTSKLLGFKQASNIVNDEPPSSVDIAKQTRGTVELSLKQDELAKLYLEAKRHQLTLNSLLLGAWALVLASHNRVNDVVFGTTVSGRSIDLTNVNTIAGLLINTLPFRAHIQADLSLAQWLATLQSSQAHMREFGQTPLADIQRCSELDAHTSLFETIMVVENLASGQALESSSTLSIVEKEYAEFSHYPLAILIDPSDGLKLIAVHQHSKISPSRAQAVLAQFQTVLMQMSQSLNTLVADVNTMPAHDQNLQLSKWNKTQHNFDDAIAVHSMFEQWARTKAEHVAITDITGMQTKHYSYGEVNKQANKLAHYLKAQLLPPNTIVPILVERSALALISFLAVMKAGCAYIPLDSTQPAQRMQAMLSSLQNDDGIVISQSALQHKLPQGMQNRILLDVKKADIEACPHHNLDLQVSMQQLAYVIFTSGSTGLPKGVMIEHKALANSTLAREQYYGKAPSTFLLLSSLSTDSSIAGIYWTLCTGNTLLLPPKGAEQDMHALGQNINQFQASHVLCIPSLYQLILENTRTQDLQSLTAVIVAGESCHHGVIALHQTLLPSTSLYNEYGPSECCVWATVRDLSAWSPSQGVPIGKAIANTQAYVLNDNLEPVLPNITGHLYIGGHNVARGYLHNEAKTNEAFVDNPFIDALSQDKLYKTGDLAKYNNEGELFFVGRADNQIKVRGFRVEPEEIEQILLTHPQVEEALVFIENSEVDDTSLLNALLAKDESDANTLLDGIEFPQHANTIIEVSR